MIQGSRNSAHVLAWRSVVLRKPTPGLIVLSLAGPLLRLPSRGKPIDTEREPMRPASSPEDRPWHWWQHALPTVSRLPGPVWVSRHRLIRGMVWAYALLLPMYGVVLRWRPWAVLLAGLLPACAAVVAGFPN